MYEDVNGNNIQDDGDHPLEGVRVDVTGADAQGNDFIVTTYSDSNGDYDLTVYFLTGLYTVTATAPEGYLFTVGGGRKTSWSVASDDIPQPHDWGLYRPILIGNFVWKDLNGNGLQDPGEPGLADVEVALTGRDGMGDSVTRKTTTDVDGWYSFDDLPPGSHKVTFMAPETYVFTTEDVDRFGITGAINSDANPQTGETESITVQSGDQVDYVDAGLYQLGSIGDFVWQDMNGNGLQDPGELGLAGVMVELVGTDGVGNGVNLTTLTDTDGLYLFEDLVPGSYQVTFTALDGYKLTAQNADGVGIKGPRNSDAEPNTGATNAISVQSGDAIDYVDAGLYLPASIGDFVWEDMNGDGLQDDGESGIQGVKVALNGTDGLGNPVSLMTWTNAVGAYLFEDLVPGSYTLTFTAPAGYAFTARDADGAGIEGTVNSDAHADTGEAEAVTLVSGDAVTYVDAGLYVPASIGNFVWEDLNGDGIHDAGEPGLPGIKVILTGTDGTGSDVVNRETTTDDNGEYWFEGLAPGTYTVTFVTPEGYVFTTQDADGEGLLGENNSDADPVTGSTPEIELLSGRTADYVDAGMFVPSVAGTVYIDSNDNGQKDPGEWGIPGVYVRLLGTDDLGDPVDAWVRTDADGNFRFTHMRAGQYELRQVHPEEFIDGKDTVGTLGTDIPESDVITGIKVGLDDRGFVGTGYLFGELGLKYPSKQLLLTIDPKSLILIREPGRGVTEVNQGTRQEQRLELTVDRLDVNRDGFVTPADALFVINQVNYSLSSGGSYRPPIQADVNGDGRVTALDALLLINYLNQAEQQQAEAEYGGAEYGGAEGEAWRFDDHAPHKLWQDDSNREAHPNCTTWCEQEEAEDWDGWRVWNEGTVDDLVDLAKFDDRADDDPRLGEVIAILARDDARRIAEPLA